MKEFTELINIMKKLRHPENGCPWDKVQTEQSLKEYILEEAYELLEAIDLNSSDKKKEELGDLLLQVVFISQINSESENFNITDVITTLKAKLINRHPHIFKNTKVTTPEQVKNNWERIKKKEKGKKSILSDYPVKMPALAIAKRYGEQASSVGFDWNDAGKAIDKIEEEIMELKIEINKNNFENIEQEIGDLLFAVANVSRLLKVNPEISLMKANNKFKRRFQHLEKIIKEKNMDISNTDLEKLEEIWQLVKEKENS
ncbi:MAG: nucleoside triphosphate pyrophosphohydrolase [Acidobacteriota bacterium]